MSLQRLTYMGIETSLCRGAAELSLKTKFCLVLRGLFCHAKLSCQIIAVVWFAEVDSLNGFRMTFRQTSWRQGRADRLQIWELLSRRFVDHAARNMPDCLFASPHAPRFTREIRKAVPAGRRRCNILIGLQPSSRASCIKVPKPYSDYMPDMPDLRNRQESQIRSGLFLVLGQIPRVQGAFFAVLLDVTALKLATSSEANGPWGPSILQNPRTISDPNVWRVQIFAGRWRKKRIIMMTAATITRSRGNVKITSMGTACFRACRAIDSLSHMCRSKP